MTTNLQSFLTAAVRAARTAGGLLKNNLDAGGRIFYKGEIDIVTEFDIRSEEIIFDQISALFPDHDFLAEEGRVRSGGSEFRWIIDPIDGTNNFAHGFPVFCVSIALERQGSSILGVVYDPMRDEMFTAVRGQGAFLNGGSIRVTTENDLGRSLLATGFPYDVRVSERNNVEQFVHFLMCALDIRRCGSAALDLCYVASGRFDGFWELKLKPWDVAAGSVIVHEAGGSVTDFSGGPMDKFGGECLASNGAIHAQMIEVLRTVRNKMDGENE